METNKHTHQLIRRIERIAVGFGEQKQETYNLVQSMRRLYLYIQGENENIADYVRHHKALWKTAEAFGATSGLHNSLVGSWIQNSVWVDNANCPTTDEKKRSEKESEEAVAASLIIGGGNCAKYGELKRELANDYLKGEDKYLATVEDARNLLQNYEPTSSRPARRPRFIHNEGLTMA